MVSVADVDNLRARARGLTWKTNGFFSAAEAQFVLHHSGAVDADDRSVMDGPRLQWRRSDIELRERSDVERLPKRWR
jgi:hypothetical protein